MEEVFEGKTKNHAQHLRRHQLISQSFAIKKVSDTVTPYLVTSATLC